MMAAGNFKINETDAFVAWGARLVDETYDNLLKPAPRKEPIVNTNDLDDGESVIPSPYKDKRTVQLIIDIEGSTKSEFLSRLAGLHAALDNGIVAVTASELGIVYNLYSEEYLTLSTGPGLRSCKLAVRMSEPDPTNRTTV